jgi:hypothetical protein
MMKFRWASLVALVLFLAACGDPVDPPDGTAEIALNATPRTIVANGGTVEVTVRVVSGTVTAFDFQENGMSKQNGAGTTYTATIPANTGPAREFRYQVIGTIEGGTVQSNTVTVTQAAGTVDPGPGPDPDGPGNGTTVQATTLQQIKDAPENANIVVQNDIVCAEPNQDTPTPQFPDGDPCIQLKPGQKLAAATPGLKITTDIPIKFGNSTDEARTTVIKMADNTAVEGFTFDGPDMYTAIEAAAAITGPVYITNVVISTATSNNAVTLRSVGELNINGLEFTTSRQVFIQDFTKATLTNLNVTINRDPAAIGAALNIQTDAATSELVLDGLNLTTNLGRGGTASDSALGMLIQNSADTTVGGNMTVTVKNSVVTFAPPSAGVNLADAVAFNFNKVGATSTYQILGGESQGNSTNSTYSFKATYGSGVTGGPIGIQ